MYAAAASCKDIALTWAPVTNWGEPHSVTRGGYCYAVLSRDASLARDSAPCQTLATLRRYGTR
jgi:hypothetical protein